MLKIFRVFMVSNNSWCIISEKHIFLLKYSASGKTTSERRLLCDWWAGRSYSHQMFDLTLTLLTSFCFICFTSSFQPKGQVIEEHHSRFIKIGPQEVTILSDWLKSTAAVDLVHWSRASFVSLYVALVAWLKAFIQNGFSFSEQSLNLFSARWRATTCLLGCFVYLMWCLN